MNSSILLAAVTAVGARLTSLVLNLVGLPIALASLGQKGFGLFLMLGGFAAVASVANLGLARVVALHTARRSTSSMVFVGEIFRMTAVTATAMGAAVFAVLAGLALALPWDRIIGGFDPALRTDFLTAAVLLALIMGLWVALAPFEGLAAGLHRLTRLNLFRSVGFLINLLGIVFVLPRVPTLTTCVLLFSSGIVLGDLLHAVFLIWNRRDIAFGRIRLRRRVVRSIYRDALSGLLFSIGFAGLFQFSTALLGMLGGPAEAVLYGITMRLLMNALSAVQGYYNAVWPAVTAGLKDEAGRPRALALIRQSIGAALVMGIAGATVVVIFGQILLRAWMGGDLGFDLPARLAAGLLCFAVVLELALKSSLLAFGLLRYSAYVTVVEAIVFLAAATFVMPRYGELGALSLLCVMHLGLAVPLQGLRLVGGIRLLAARRG